MGRLVRQPASRTKLHLLEQVLRLELVALNAYRGRGELRSGEQNCGTAHKLSSLSIASRINSQSRKLAWSIGWHTSRVTSTSTTASTVATRVFSVRIDHIAVRPCHAAGHKM
jgi:hypothetical protein